MIPHGDASVDWPKDSRGKRKPVKFEPVLGLNLCEQCWDGKHSKRERCPIVQCQCGCYVGRNQGLSKPHAPHKDCKENQELPDAGTITA